jgi:hypothetical protein
VGSRSGPVGLYILQLFFFCEEKYFFLKGFLAVDSILLFEIECPNHAATSLHSKKKKDKWKRKEILLLSRMQPLCKGKRIILIIKGKKGEAASLD